MKLITLLAGLFLLTAAPDSHARESAFLVSYMDARFGSGELGTYLPDQEKLLALAEEKCSSLATTVKAVYNVSVQISADFTPCDGALIAAGTPQVIVTALVECAIAEQSP